MDDEAEVTTEQRERSGRREQNKAENRTALLKAARAQGILPNVDVSYLAASMAGIAFEISMVMVARDPVDPAAAAEFATRLMMGGLDNVPRR